jgi:Spy/CpxP family protein refolding chaperone
MSKRVYVRTGVGLWLALLVAAPLTFGTSGHSQEAAKAEKDSAKTRVFRGRLPANWGKLGISEEQRQRIYAMQIKAHDRIEALERELEQLKTQLEQAELAVLTPQQRARLAEIEAEARAKRANRSKAKSGTADPKKDK